MARYLSQKKNVVNVKIKMKELIADLENIIDHANIGQNIILQKISRI